MKHMKNHKKAIFLSIVILVSIAVALICIIKINKTNKRIMAEASNISFDTKEKREEGIEKLTQLLEDSPWLKSTDKIIIINNLSTMYLMNWDYNNGLEWTTEGIYWARKCGNVVIEAKCLIDMSNVFMELNQYDIGESILKYALGLETNNKQDEHFIKFYAYMNLADIYAREDRNKEALKYAEKSQKYANASSDLYEMDMLTLAIIKARAYFNDGNIEACKRVLRAIEQHKEKYEYKMVSNVHIPYLALKAEIEVFDGYIEEGIKTVEKMFYICDKEGLMDTKRKCMDYILEVLNKHYGKEYIKKIYEYDYDMFKEYDKIIRVGDRTFSEFMLRRCKSKYNELQAREDEVRVSVQTVIIMSMLVTLCTVAMHARAYKMQTQIDFLTKIFNRRKFDHDYKKVISNKKKFGIIVIDIDHFKVLNDNYGHDFGDIVIENVAKLIKNKLSRDEEIYRYGGEEFCVLCYNKGLDDVVCSAEAIRREVEGRKWREGVQVTISLGVACKGQQDDVFKLADKNLYKSKENGRNRVTYTE